MSWLLWGSTLPSFVVACLAAYLVRRVAPALGLVDDPGHRKMHDRRMPLGGGVAIWLGVVLPLAAGQVVLWLVARGAIRTSVLPESIRAHVPGLMAQSGELWILLAGATAMLLLGLADDRIGLGWRVRIAVQGIVAVWIVWHGWRLDLFLDQPVVTLPLSVLWIVGLTNTFNMLDNMDGLSAGVAAIVAAVLACVMLTVPGGPQLFVAGLLLVLTGALAGFLWHNHAPARLFMGDAGAYFIGFLLAAATLTGTFAGPPLPRHAILVPLCALAVPLYDTATVVAIRIRAGRSPFEGDTSHFSHRLVEMGLSRAHAVWTIYLATATCGFGAILLYQVDTFGAVVIMLMVISILAIIAILETAVHRGRLR